METSRKKRNAVSASKTFRIVPKNVSLSAATTFIQPDLEITKQAPDMASLCDPCRTSEGEEALTSSEANAQTTIVAVPALRVSVVDEQDPIRGGDQVVYKIVVFNQGKAPDKNVQVSAELPGNLEFQQASGETSASADGRQVSFEAVEQVMPGEKLEWKLIAAAEGSGEALIKVNVSSDSLEGTVQSQEPTYLLGESSNGSSGN